MACGLWCAIRRYSSATRLGGASGTRYVSLRGPIGSRPMPPTVSASRRRGAGRPGAPVRPARAPGRAVGRPMLVSRPGGAWGVCRACRMVGPAARRGE
eukprot:5441920-Prymnesium_polylepis.1